ncbi:DUF932 domain-containing protein [Chromobacterium alticapitis]|uniref:DUF932 domain-containing protein n=1 Tax=Chromobacterium alticapitis TaxID=2073169 RepID=UPI001E2A3FEC|nr:DUF932 domain-containing protein [Chromobacterium alticapitis]
MAHLVETMAYVGATPWHGLGNRLSEGLPVNIWQREAGVNWTIEQSDVLFNVAPGGMHIRPHADAKVLYRSDTFAPLSVVFNRHKVVQPHEVLSFYNDLVHAGGFELDRGCIEGRTVSCGRWRALARRPKSAAAIRSKPICRDVGACRHRCLKHPADGL